MGKKLFNVSIVVLVTFLCPLSTIVAIAAGSIFTATGEEPPAVAVDFRAPSEVVVGEPFTIEFSVTNSAETVQTLDDIDLNPGALERMRLARSTPAFDWSSHDPFFQTYWYELGIQPGSTLDVAWEMVALEAGSHSLRLGVCINSAVSCRSFEAILVARAPGE